MKTYTYKIYDNTGEFITTWKDVGLPRFSMKINSGLSELTVKLGRGFFNFGENFDVKIGNILRLYVSDVEEPGAIKIYDGQLSKYHLIMNKNEEVEVTFVGFVTEMSKRIVVDGSDTTISYATEDPSDIIRDAIDKVSGSISYTSNSIDDTDLSVSYDVVQNTLLEVVQRMADIAPQNWYWYLDENNILQFHEWTFDDVTKLYIGKHVQSLDMTKSGENLYNNYFFLGGGSPALYTRTERANSILEYGQRDIREQDERITDDGTADNKAASFLDQHDHPTMEVSVTVIDSNVDAKSGIDIEKLRPGQAVQILHPEVATRTTLFDIAIFDVDVFDFDITSALGQPLRIEEVEYFGTGARLKLGVLPINLIKRIKENTIQLENYRTKDSPTTPTT